MQKSSEAIAEHNILTKRLRNINVRRVQPSIASFSGINYAVKRTRDYTFGHFDSLHECFG